MLALAKRPDVNEATDISEDDEIDLFCAHLLISWNMTKGGKPVGVGDEAVDLFKNQPGGRNFFRTLATFAAQPAQFKRHPSKKSSSSESSRTTAKSATSRKRSASKPKPAADKSRAGSKTT